METMFMQNVASSFPTVPQCIAFNKLTSVIASWIHSYFDNVMTKFMINGFDNVMTKFIVNNRTDA